MEGTETTRRPPGRPRRAPVEEQRQQILAAARHLFAEHDFYGTSIEAVAREAGVARPLVYELFGGKSELFVAVVDDAVSRMIDRFAGEDPVTDQLSLTDRVRGPVTAWFDFIRDQPDVAAMVRIAEYGGLGPAKSEVAAGRQRIEDGLAAVYELLWEPLGGVTTETARLLALMTLSLTEAVGFRQESEPAWDRAEAVDLVTSFIVGGLVGVDRTGPLARSFGEPRVGGPVGLSAPDPEGTSADQP